MSEQLYKLYKEGSTNRDEAIELGSGIVDLGIDPQEVQKRYSIWAPKYEGNFSYIDYVGPKFAAEEMGSYLRDKKKARILDCAAGTGLLGLHLSQQGFTNIDALDANEMMLEVAKKKGVYTNFIKAFLGPNKLDIADNTYDGLTLTAAFCEGHVKPDCLPEFARIVKPGGFIVFGVRELTLVDTPHNQNFEWLTQNMEKCGVWRQLMRKVQPNYYAGDAGVIWCFTPLEKF